MTLRSSQVQESSALSPESDIILSPRQRQITSETSSCPSDNEIISLYGKYRNSGYSMNENFEQDQQQDDSENSRQYSFTQGDDANGLPLGRTSTVIDELTWMLGEAINSAQTTFGNPEEITSETQDQLSDVRSYSPLVNGLNRLSIDKGRNLHTPQGIRPGEHSAEDLSEPITASSLSDYSADESEDLQGAKEDAFTTWWIQVLPVPAMRHSNIPTRPMTWMLLQKSEDNSPSQDPSKITRAYKKDYTESVISTGVQSTSSEEVLSTSAIAIRIRRTSENQLVEMVHPDRSDAMIMNSLMEVNNIPYPSLYPHSAGQHLGVQQVPSESSSLSSPMSSKLSGGSRSILESSSKVVGGAGGRFFSQIKRHNSTKRRNQSASASSPPTKSNLIISAPMITGPLTGPRGPRPELGSSSKVGGNELKGLFTKAQDVMTIAPSRMSHDEQPCSPRTTSRGNHRMSFAYGTSTHRHPPTTAPKLTHQQYQVSSGYGGGGALGRRPSEPIDRSLNFNSFLFFFSKNSNTVEESFGMVLFKKYNM
ncbi:hypothetical protein PSTT_06710 [Puccinia striiformis]|uniref:Uncharacterized protein n=1 Tax=Puccinia striiformis TaxID=27350 RepID=A0A2S4VJL3_9BASI|nr:hypothetical protein PSTT_06710 [Puccinia striiformis]